MDWRMKILLNLLVFSDLILTINGEAEVVIQLLTYSNPTFGLAEINKNYFYCAYQSPDVPPIPVAVRSASQNAPDQRPPQVQQYPNQQQYQNQQYFQNQQNQQNQQNPYQQNPQGQVPNRNQQGQMPYRQPNQQGQQGQFQQGQQGQQFQQGQHPYQQNPNQQNPQYPPNPYQQQPQNQPSQQYPQQSQYAQNQQQPIIHRLQQCVQPSRDVPIPNWNECKFSFATVFSTLSGEPVVISTGLIPLPSNTSTILFNDTTWNEKCVRGNCADRTWSLPRNRTFKIKPNLIEVVVTHFGDSVYFLGNNQYTPMGNDQAQLVDTIGIHVANLTPSAASVYPPPLYHLCVNGDQKSSSGSPLSTLILTVSVRCVKNTFGQFCNMTNCSIYDNSTQICASSLYPSQSLICNYDHNLMQPVNCTMCALGVANGRCRTEDSFYRTESASITGYIVGLIILAILLAIAIGVICVGFFSYRKKQDPSNSNRNKPQQQQQTTTSTGWFGTKAPPRQNGNPPQTRAGYTAAPTEEPNTDSEWGQAQRSPVREQVQQQPPLRPYNFPPPPARQPPSNASTPEHNGSRREAAV